MRSRPFGCSSSERRSAVPEVDVVEELTEAIRLTVEYVGLETLPPIEGWSWWDALVKYAPEKAQVFVRRQVNTLVGDVTDTHRMTFDHEWSVLSQQRGAQAPAALLDELGALGFAWRDVARLLGVSVPAIKKWRSGESLAGSNRGKLSRLVAACDLLTDHYHVEDIASWFEMPLRDDVPVTPIDLWITGSPQLFFEYGTRHATAGSTLDALDPEWRDRYRTDVETFRDADGRLSLRKRGIEHG